MIQLRDVHSNDNLLLVQYLNNENVTRYLSSKIPSPYSLEDAKWWIEVGSKDNAIVKAITFNNTFCGVVGIYTQAFEYQHSAEIGYWIAEKYWNQGIGSHAVKQFVEFIFTSTEIKRLFNPVSEPNFPSIKVMEKAGFYREGILKQSVYKNGKYYDEHLYAKVKYMEIDN